MTHCLSNHAIALLFVIFGLITPCILNVSAANAANLDTPSSHSLAVKNEKGATNTIAEKERLDSEKQAVLDAIESWRTAWSAEDQENYFRAYAADFTPAHLSSPPAWKKYKKHLFAIRSYMRVRLGSINIEILETGRRARARFHQKYDANGYHSIDNKELLLTNKNGGWKIIREHIIPATQNMTRVTRIDQKLVEASKAAKDSPGQNKAESGHSQVEATSSAAKIGKQSKEKDRTEKQAMKNAHAIENKKPQNPFSIRAEADYRRALKLIKEGENGKALGLLAPYTVTPKNYPEITADYIAVLVWVGKLDKAIEKYEALPDGFPRRAYLLRNVAKAYYDKKRYGKALSLYKATLRNDASDQVAQQGLVLALMRSGEPGKAEVQLDAFLLKEPESPALNMVKPGVLAARGKYGQSVHKFRSLLARKDTDRDSIYRDRRNLIFSLAPEKQRVMLSQLRRDAKQKPGALSRDYIVALALTRHFNGAVRVFKASKLAVSSFSDYDLGMVAWSYFKIGDVKQSKRYYRQILAVDAKDTQANIGISYILATEGRTGAALSILNKLLKAQPRNIDIRYGRAFVFEKQKKFQQAINEYRRIQRIDPGAKAAREAIREAKAGMSRVQADHILDLVRHGKVEQAEKRLNQALKEDPGSIPLTKARPQVLAVKGEYAEALAQYRRILRIRGVDREKIIKAREHLITSLPPAKQQAMLTSLRRVSKQKGGGAAMDYILALALTRHYRSAIDTFEATHSNRLNQKTVNAAKTMAGNGKQAVLDAIESWRTAWSGRDRENYFRAYAADFAPAHPSSLPAWKKYKKHLFAIRSYMRVRLDSVNIEMLETERRARARFRQKYDANGYHSVDNKELLLSQKGDGWKIVRERIISSAQVKSGPAISRYELSQLAWAYFKTGAYRQSGYYYQKILSGHPEDTRANTGMAYNLAMEGKGDEAIAILNRLLKKQPNDIDVRYARAYVFEKQEKFGLVASEYERILVIAPDAMAAKPALVLNLVDAGDADKAARLLDKFQRDNPDYLPLILTRPRVLAGQGKYGMVLESYRQLAARSDVNRQTIFRKRDGMITSLPDNKRKALLNSLHRKAQQGKQNALRDFILAQVLHENYKTATKTFEDAGLPHEQYSLNELNWIAWAYFKLGNTEQSKQLYLKTLKEDPGLLRARIGMAYNLALEGRMLSGVKKHKESKIKTNEAMVMADGLVKDFPNDVEAHFARAYVFEQQELFWRAIHEYDEVLRIAPENLVAVKLKLMDLSSLGASSIALEELGKKLPGDGNLRKSLRGDMVVDSLHWDEFNKAVKMIQPLLTEKKDVRPRFDYIVALAENRDMKKAIDAYQKLLDDGISPPSWVLENVGRAYLYLKKPGKALETYDMALELDPRSYNARFGKFYVLQETRKWKDAEKILAKLDREYRWTYWQGKQKRPVPRKLEIAIAKGWKLAYEDRLNEAEEYFANLHRQAPANSEIRAALAYVYLFRGWPRKALMEFQINETMDPENLEAKIGKIRALNELKFKEEARKEKNAIIYQPGKEYYKRINVKKLDRDLLLEAKFRIGFDFVYEDSTDDSSDYLARLRLTAPLTLNTDLTAYVFRRKTAQLESFGQFDRVGLGLDHTFNSDWRAAETVSFDVNQGSEFGSLTELVYTPDDHWRLDASYDTFAVDIALRARAFGIRARKASAGVTYRQSEWREIALGYTHWDFSDKNNRDEGLLRYEQGLWVRNDWRQRLFLEYYLARNSLLNRPYFNPRWAWSITGTLMTQQTLWDIYDRKFVHKLFLTGGNYNQSSFGNKGIMIIRYQQEIDFSDTQALLWGITWSRQPFDGDFVNTRNLYLTYEGKF